MIRRFRRRRLLRALPLALAGLLVAAPAATAGVRIQSIDLTGFPAVRTTVVAPLGAPAPTLTENGHRAVGFSAVNLGREKAVILALDRSQSMRGKPLAAAVAAADSLTGAAGAHDHVGVVAFGRDAIALTGTSSPPADARNALQGLTVDTRPGTALYDAVYVAAGRLAGDDRPGRAIVVVTDGRDVSSTHSLGEAIDAAHRAHAAVYTIGIGGPSFTPDALRMLARQTGGSYRQATSAAGLGGIYAALQDELARTWQLSYVTSASSGSTLILTATVRGAGTATARAEAPGVGTAPAAATGLIPAFGYSTVGTAAIAVVSGLLVLLSCLFWFASRQGGRLRSRIEPHLGLVEHGGQARRRESRAAARTQVANTLERVLGDLRQFKRLQLAIERADLPLRAGELAAMCVGCGLFFGMVAAVAGAPTLAILFAMVVFGFAPFAYVAVKAATRIKRFENQLPDLLITIAASLKAGHSFRQGIQSVVDEGAEPAAKEFRRVLNETQLGKPMDDALVDLGRRIGSKNLTFVINAVTIQRQIGGSLAGLFDMVADTVRQRQQFVRKVKGLTAMGRMSAYTLVGLPFFIAAVVTMMNPRYMQPLYHTAAGQQMIGAGAAMIVVGSLLLKKTVSFKG